jgi:hypothetical protein
MTATEQEGARVVYAPADPGGRAGAAGRRSFALLAAVFAIFCLGLAAGRLSAARPADGTAASAPQAPEASAADPASGAPEQAAVSTGGAIPGVGPARVVDGVGVGYARSREGAVAAATNYVKVLASPLIFDPGRRRAAIRRLAAPDAVERLERAYDASTPRVAEGLFLPPDGGTAGTQVLLMAAPVSYHVDAYSADRATVSIWQTTVAGSGGGAPPLQAWGTTTVTLRWTGGDWKQVSATSRAGPVPLPDSALPTDVEQLLRQLENYKEYRYAPGS